MSNFEEMIKIAYEYQEFCSPNDNLSDIIDNNELSIFDLDHISAARSDLLPSLSTIINQKISKKN